MTALWQSRELAQAAAEMLRRLAQPQRLMILSLLLAGEKSVTEIDVAAGIGQPALSQQLAELRRAGLVSTRRQARQVYYRLAGNAAEVYLRGIEAMLAGEAMPAPAVAPQAAIAEPAAAERRGGAANFAQMR